MKALLLVTALCLTAANSFAGTAMPGNFCGRIVDDGDSVIVQDSKYDAKIYLYNDDDTKISDALKQQLTIGSCQCVRGVVNSKDSGVQFIEVYSVTVRPESACR